MGASSVLYSRTERKGRTTRNLVYPFYVKILKWRVKSLKFNQTVFFKCFLNVIKCQWYQNRNIWCFELWRWDTKVHETSDTHTSCYRTALALVQALLINTMFYHEVSVFFPASASRPLSVRRWTRYSCCWLLCSILAMHILRLWQMPIQRSLLTCSWWREVSVTSTWCQQHMWDWKESNCFHTNINTGMRMHTCMRAAGVSVFCLTPPPSLYDSSECSCDLWH